MIYSVHTVKEGKGMWTLTSSPDMDAEQYHADATDCEVKHRTNRTLLRCEAEYEAKHKAEHEAQEAALRHELSL